MAARGSSRASRPPAARSPSSSASSPARRRRCGRSPACARSCAAATCLARPARAAGLGLDEISSARGFTSSDSREAALLAFLESVLDSDGHPELHLLEEAREIGWTDEQIIEAIAHLALNEFQSLVANAAALPQDQSDPRILPNAA